jgi:NAD(P)-dependent dehydrogenase (short-subunit alcohol dehydrogenase family)
VATDGARVITVRADVSEEADVLRLFETVDREPGR